MLVIDVVGLFLNNVEFVNYVIFNNVIINIKCLFLYCRFIWVFYKIFIIINVLKFGEEFLGCSNLFF